MQQLIKNYVTRHLQAGFNSLGQLSRAPLNSLIICLLIGFALALPTALFVILKNAEMLSHQFQQTTQLTLYLKKDLPQTEVTQLHSFLEKKTGASVKMISPEQGLKELQVQSGFDGILQELPNNPLPWVLVITPNQTLSPSLLEKWSEEFRKLSEVDSLQSDLIWIKRWQTLIEFMHRAAFSLAIFLSVAVLLIVNNAIRGATLSNQKEIEVIKLIGGNNAFIRRPFLYAGMIYGLLGAIIAWLTVDTLLLLLRTPADKLAMLYGSQYHLIGISFSDTLALLFGSLLLGLIGSFAAVTRHLKIC